MQVRRRPSRPPSCRRCAVASWWNGWRLTRPLVAQEDGRVERVEHWLARAKCPCCRRSITCYPETLYPRRQFQLDVVASVVAAIVLGGERAATAAHAAQASPTSARRWTRWMAELAEPGELARVTAHVDPDTPAGVGLGAWSGASVRARAARVLGALEQLGAALVRRGLVLAQSSGLGRVLGWQRSLFGDVVHLVAAPKTLSPAMALGGAPSGR